MAGSWRWLVMVGWLLAASGAPVGQASGAGAAAGGPEHIVLVYTAAISGELEPCGCTTGPLGGFAHRGPIIQRIRDGGSPTLVLDAGDLLLKGGLTAAEASVGDTERARLILDLTEAQGARAFAVGANDLAAVDGVSGLRKLLAGRQIKALSANVFGEGGGRIFDASAVFTVGSTRVGILGITGPSVAFPWEISSTRIVDPVAPALEEARRLRPSVDLLVALSNQDERANEALAAAIPELDFILSGPRDNQTNSGAGFYDADGAPPFLVPLGPQGRFVGRLDLVVAEDRPRPAPELGRSLKGEQIARESLAEMEARILEEEGAPNPERVALQGATLRAEIDRAHAVRAAPRAHTGFYYTPLPVVPGRVVDTAAQARIADFKEAQQREAAVAARAYAPVVSFAGSASCRGCHPLQTAQWLGTDHSRAWETLEKLGREKDQACVGCHATGFGQSGGFLIPEDVAGYEGVGCEACHGPLSDHPARRRFITPTTRSTCVGCHDAANSPGFDYAASRPSVTCPAGVSSPGGLVGETHPGH